MTIQQVSQRSGLTQDTLRYYERAGLIPPVTRTAGGKRDYTEMDLKWVELASCMRSAGLPVEAIAKYVQLFQAGSETIPARLKLLREQHDRLQEQRQHIDRTLERLAYKIELYEEAAETGRFRWEKGE